MTEDELLHILFASTILFIILLLRDIWEKKLIERQLGTYETHGDGTASEFKFK